MRNKSPSSSFQSTITGTPSSIPSTSSIPPPVRATDDSKAISSTSSSLSTTIITEAEQRIQSIARETIGLDNNSPILHRVCEQMRHQLVFYEWQLPVIDSVQWHTTLQAPIGLIAAIQICLQQQKEVVKEENVLPMPSNRNKSTSVTPGTEDNNNDDYKQLRNNMFQEEEKQSDYHYVNKQQQQSHPVGGGEERIRWNSSRQKKKEEDQGGGEIVHNSVDVDDPTPKVLIRRTNSDDVHFTTSSSSSIRTTTTVHDLAMVASDEDENSISQHHVFEDNDIDPDGDRENETDADNAAVVVPEMSSPFALRKEEGGRKSDDGSSIVKNVENDHDAVVVRSHRNIGPPEAPIRRTTAEIILQKSRGQNKNKQQQRQEKVQQHNGQKPSTANLKNNIGEGEEEDDTQATVLLSTATDDVKNHKSVPFSSTTMTGEQNAENGNNRPKVDDDKEEDDKILTVNTSWLGQEHRQKDATYINRVDEDDCTVVSSNVTPEGREKARSTIQQQKQKEINFDTTLPSQATIVESSLYEKWKELHAVITALDLHHQRAILGQLMIMANGKSHATRFRMLHQASDSLLDAVRNSKGSVNPLIQKSAGRMIITMGQVAKLNSKQRKKFGKWVFNAISELCKPSPNRSDDAEEEEEDDDDDDDAADSDVPLVSASTTSTSSIVALQTEGVSNKSQQAVVVSTSLSEEELEDDADA